MSDHLSEDQFARYAAGRPARAELQHVSECAECSAELVRFGSTLSLFRTAIRHQIDERVAAHQPSLAPPAPAAGISTWRWAWVTAAVILAVLPFFMSENKLPEAVETPAADTNPNAVMDRVNAHLSRIVPAPMEPIMALIPGEEFENKSGGVQ
jgi:hypothetical protein